MKVFFAIAIAMIAQCAMAAEDQVELPQTQVIDSPAFDTIEEAAVSVLLTLSQPFAAHEFGGAIIEREGKFYFTNPITMGSEVALDFALNTKRGDKFVGLYHTHPRSSKIHDLKSLQQFSLGDLGVARAHNLVSYLAEEGSRSIRVFDPQSDYGQRAFKTKPHYGQLVGKIADLASSTQLALNR